MLIPSWIGGWEMNLDATYILWRIFYIDYCSCAISADLMASMGYVSLDISHVLLLLRAW